MSLRHQCHPTISSSVAPFSSCLQSFPASESFSIESALHIRWPKCWSFTFSVSPSSEYSALVSFRTDCCALRSVRGVLRSLLPHRSMNAVAVAPSSSGSGWRNRAPAAGWPCSLWPCRDRHAAVPAWPRPGGAWNCSELQASQFLDFFCKMKPLLLFLRCFHSFSICFPDF